MVDHASIVPQFQPAAAAREALPIETLTHEPYLNSYQRLPLQRKLTVGAVDDPLEDEADAMADRVMRMPEPTFIQRKCAHCEQKEQVQRKPLASFIQRKANEGGNIASEAVTNQIQASQGTGSALPANTKSFMESRFGTEFSGVTIHTDTKAVQLSQHLNAQAFTVGQDIYFNAGKYTPESAEGKRLLAHELTHTVQQSHAPTRNPLQNDISESSEAHIARFTDTGHHIIEEAGLAGGGFTEEQIRQIERGNIKRDYSQLPGILNFVLLCEPDTFGGYHASDHFDDYIWNNDKQVFEDRGKKIAEQAGLGKVYKGTGDPILQIQENLTALMHLGPTKEGFEHLGNAFHAVEDFFAHSNFINLTMNDYRFGHDLITGSNDEGAGQIATANSLNAVSVPGLPVTPPGYVDKIKKDAPALSHSKIAKDYPSDPLHYQARQLAALVVQALSRDIITILNNKEPAKRKQLCEEVVFTKIRRYLRPPDAAKDPWWTELIAADKGAIDALLKKAEQATPVTVNQCVLSPLANLEATRTSPVRVFGMGNPVIGLGRYALSPLMGGLNLKDIALGSVPSVSIPFTIDGKRANLTMGGMLLLPFGSANTMIPDEKRFWPENALDHGRDKYEKPQSMIGVSVSRDF